MFSGYKKYSLSLVLLLVFAGLYFFYFSSQWGIAISKEQTWNSSFQEKKELDFKGLNWETKSKVLNISEATKKQHIVFQKEFEISNPSKILAAALELNYKYAVKVFINHVECADVPRDLISSASDKNGLRIAEYWRPRRVVISQKKINAALKKGKNTIFLLVSNVKDFSKINCTKKQLSFYTRGHQNNFKQKLKLEKPTSYFTASSLPLLKINTGEKAILDEPKISATLQLIDNGTALNHCEDTSILHPIKIETRGHTSQTFAKKSYSFHLYNENDKRTSVGLLGLPSSKKWVLYGPYADKSLIRNALTYALYQQMGNYAPSTKFVELIINDNYRGIYLLTEKIQLSPDHLNLTPFQIQPSDSNSASGGYLLEIDRNTWKGIYPPANDTSAIPTSYMVKSPKRNQLNPIIEKRMQAQYNTFEKHLYQNDAIYDYLDLNSFIDYLLITEFTKNIDGYCLSTFLYNKNINDSIPKFYMGPIWDYNFSLGLTDYREGFNPEGYVYNSTKYIPFWWKKLLKDKKFKAALAIRYFNLRKTVLSNQNIMKNIDAMVHRLGSAPQSNFQKWTVLDATDFWPNYFLGKTYEDEINYLKKWITDRLYFLDNDIFSKKDVRYYQIAILNNKEWMLDIKKKAKQRNISMEEMITIDAKYMANK
jgi:hypothetical protein